MSIVTGASSTAYVYRSANFPDYTDMTCRFWFYLVSDRNAVGVIFYIIEADGNPYQGILMNTDGTTPVLFTSNSTFDLGNGLTVGTWVCFVYTRSGSTHKLYQDGVETGSFTDALTMTPGFMLWGSDSVSYVNARYANILVVDRAWTAAEVSADYANMNYFPLDYTDVIEWHPGFAGATERLADYSGNGRALLGGGGTLTDGDNPPLIWGKMHQDYYKPAGATVYNVTVAGSISASGALIKSPHKNFAGSITPSGVAIKQTAKIFGASITPSGLLVKSPRKVLTGSISPSGDFAKVPNKVLTGSISASGALQRNTSKILAGSITPAGTILKNSSKILSGSITPEGAEKIGRAHV